MRPNLRQMGQAPVLALMLALALLTSCGKKETSQTPAAAANEKKWIQSEAELRYKLIQTELKLAESTKPYLVIDLSRKEIELRLQGAVVWNFPLQLEDSTSNDLRSFAQKFMNPDDKLVRPLLVKHLFDSQTQTPDSILKIVSNATSVKADLMQREIPGRFQLVWTDDLILDIRTDAVGVPTSKWKNRLIDLKQNLQKPFGNSVIVIKMPKQNALTLYRAAQPGIPTLIYPAV